MHFSSLRGLICCYNYKISFKSLIKILKICQELEDLIIGCFLSHNQVEDTIEILKDVIKLLKTNSRNIKLKAFLETTVFNGSISIIISSNRLEDDLEPKLLLEFNKRYPVEFNFKTYDERYFIAELYDCLKDSFKDCKIKEQYWYDTD